ncbi:MAG: hypothetical protein ACYC1M_15865 [Armatimonadota bacterium]
MRRIVINICIVIVLIVIYEIAMTAVNYLDVHMYINLPGGYDMWRSRYGVVMENKKDPLKFWHEKNKIGPNVGGYRVYPKVIVGQVTIHPNDHEGYATLSWDHNERRPGYFIVDLHTRKVYDGLSKQAWLAKLKSYSITDEPKLHKPHWLDEYTGWNKPVDVPAR